MSSTSVNYSLEGKKPFTPETLLKTSQVFLSSLTTSTKPPKIFHYTDSLLLQEIAPSFLKAASTDGNSRIGPLNIAFFILEIALNEFFFIAELCIFVKSLKT